MIIVNETLARRFWPDAEAVGKRMRFYGPLDKNPWMQVVGVVQDVKHELNLPVTPDYYLPHAQDPWNAMVLVAKTKVEPAAMAGPIRQEVWSIDKGQPVFDVRTMKEVRAMSVALYSFSSGIAEHLCRRGVAARGGGHLRRDGLCGHRSALMRLEFAWRSARGP